MNVIITVQRSIWCHMPALVFFYSTLSLELNLAPLLRSSSRAGRLPPLQAQCTAVASSYEHAIKKLHLRIIIKNKCEIIFLQHWCNSHIHHLCYLVFLIHGCSTLQELLHDLYVTLGTGFMQS